MRNMPEVKLGLIAVSRDCFPITLSDRRSQEVVAAAKEQGVEIYRSKTIVESETDMLKAVDDIQAEACCISWQLWTGKCGDDYRAEICGTGDVCSRSRGISGGSGAGQRRRVLWYAQLFL